MESRRVKPIEILLVEDNPGDVVLTQEAFSEAKILNNLQVVKDGEEALQYLFREGDYQQAKRPELILLDLNLPKVDGRQVLDKIKNSDVLKRIPVVVLTSSQAEKDIVKTYDLHANSYVVKPINLSQFVDVVNAVENFWFSVVALPTLDE
ncbi:response regulator [Reinekea thalattae]|uniref:Response regulator n=1 Tax=Reinekea thalattae TaxID=2593301 RepID=A0A5C8ZBB5_9GAMM|nr:response regulator [Reinekea thalattae]TXR54481.1 response regulator [Reinekea thalattae]